VPPAGALVAFRVPADSVVLETDWLADQRTASNARFARTTSAEDASAASIFSAVADPSQPVMARAAPIVRTMPLSRIFFGEFRF
jgi:hypothetical protein